MQVLEPGHSVIKDQDNLEVAEKIIGAISMVEAVNEIGGARTMEGIIDADNAKAKDDSHKSEVTVDDVAYKYTRDNAASIPGAVHDEHYDTEVVIDADNTVHSRAASHEESGTALAPQNVSMMCFIFYQQLNQ